MRPLALLCVCAGILLSGCVSARNWNGIPSELPPPSRDSAFGPPPTAAQVDSAGPVTPADLSPLARELRIVRAKAEAAQQGAVTGGLGLMVAGVSGYAALPASAETKHKIPWISMAAAGLLMVVSAAVP